MKAALLYGPKELRIQDVPVPVLSHDEVLVRIRAIGICPSDVRVYEGIYKRRLFSYGCESYGLMGHEWAGEVAEVGESVKDVASGDAVVPEIIIPCGTCRPCRKGLSNLCARKTNVTRGFAEYAKAPSSNLLRVPANISMHEAAFAEPLAVCLHTNDILSPGPGETILIVGAGPMGLLNLQVSKLSGATVIVSEVSRSRLDMARGLGADSVINPLKEDLSRAIMQATESYGADAVIVATGNRTAIEEAFRCVGPAGTVVLFGGTYPPDNVQIDPNIVHYKEVKITGSYDHLPIHMERALGLLSQKAIDVLSLVSHRLSLENLQEGFELVGAANTLKVLIEP